MKKLDLVLKKVNLKTQSNPVRCQLDKTPPPPPPPPPPKKKEGSREGERSIAQKNMRVERKKIAAVIS
jgi:hypothetical protein